MSEITRQICKTNKISHERLAEIYLEYIHRLIKEDRMQNKRKRKPKQ